MIIDEAEDYDCEQIRMAIMNNEHISNVSECPIHKFTF